MKHTTNQRRFIKYHKKVSLTMIIVNFTKIRFHKFEGKVHVYRIANNVLGSGVPVTC